jgi:predicted kinase
MRKYSTLASFYAGDDWSACKAEVLRDRMKGGAIYCEHCGEVILKDFNPKERNNAGAMVFHHKRPLLTVADANNAAISINPQMIAILHWKCHNVVHGRFSGQNTQPEQKVYLITGAPCSGKTTFARDRMEAGDVLIDIDDIWQQISGQPRYTKPNSLKPLVFATRDEQEDKVRMRAGTWRNAFIIKSLPLPMDRRREAEKLGAEVITIETPKEECLARLRQNPQGRNVAEYEEFIENYFSMFQN